MNACPVYARTNGAYLSIITVRIDPATPLSGGLKRTLKVFTEVDRAGCPIIAIQVFQATPSFRTHTEFTLVFRARVDRAWVSIIAFAVFGTRRTSLDGLVVAAVLRIAEIVCAVVVVITVSSTFARGALAL